MRRALLAWAALGAIGMGMAPTRALAEPTTQADARARLHYLQYCAGCHLADGRGAPAKGIPSMREGVLARLTATPAGKAYLSRVPGVVNTPLSVDETTQLMNWVLRSFGDSAQPLPSFTAPEIAEGRAHKLTDPVPVRASLLGS